jgi:hypothetical protein
MASSADRLYNLLPVIDRLRDQEQGQPLRALLQVIAAQVDVVEDDITRLYENWFIETCDDWVVPYIADLIGYRAVAAAGAPGPADTAEGRLLNRFLVPRREVANLLRHRRRKGALALLELLAADVAGWPARAVEFYRLLGWNQPAKFVAPDRGRLVDLRRGDALDRIGGAFDEFAHTVDARRIGAARGRGRGRYGIPHVGLFVWRLKPYSVTRAPAFCVDRVRNQYTFSMLGNDAPLFTLPIAEPTPTSIADELNVPAAIRRRAFDERTADYYGPGKSLRIWRDDLEHPVPPELIVPADLSDWVYRPQGEQVAVDPVLGRIAFAPRLAPRTGVWVTYHYGFSDDIGGGEYDRPIRPTGQRQLYQVNGAAVPGEAPPQGPPIYPSIKAAIAAWRDEHPDDAVIEILDSGAYVEQLEIRLDVNQRLELRAANRCRPVIRLLDFYTNRPDALQIIGAEALEECEKPPRIVLDGLLITGRSVNVSGRIGKLSIRHCTLVPGWSLDHACEPENQEDPSLELNDTGAQVVVERSILGSIRVGESEVKADPIAISLSDSILDATARDLDAIDTVTGIVAHTRLTFKRCTVFGRVNAHAIDLAENSIFDGRVFVARRQIGCMRFCYVPGGSRTPRRYNCQPDLAIAAARAEAEAALLAEGAAAAAIAQARRESAERAQLRVQPQFSSVRYGTPAYAQLAPGCPEEIRRGADDESEMGAFHDLFEPQREAMLRARLAEYSPAVMAAEVVFVS